MWIHKIFSQHLPQFTYLKKYYNKQKLSIYCMETNVQNNIYTLYIDHKNDLYVTIF